VLRILDKTSSLKPLEALGFSEYNLKKFESIITQPYGMILISGQLVQERPQHFIPF